MGTGEIILIAACVVIVGAVLGTWIYKKAKGKPTCDCGGDCAHCAYCKYEQAKKDK